MKSFRRWQLPWVVFQCFCAYSGKHLTPGNVVILMHNGGFLCEEEIIDALDYLEIEGFIDVSYCNRVKFATLSAKGNSVYLRFR